MSKCDEHCTSGLRQRWADLCARIGGNAACAVALFDCLLALYEHPPRAYHNLGHVTALLKVFDEAKSVAHRPNELEFAIWLHDCVYVAGRDDNEARSAAVAHAFLAALSAGADARDRVRGMILATRHAGPADHPDERLIADIDLSTLAIPPSDFDENARRIREEFASIPDTEFARGRLAFIESFLARPSIYQTDHFRHTSEDPARANLSRALSRLRSLAQE